MPAADAAAAGCRVHARPLHRPLPPSLPAHVRRVRPTALLPVADRLRRIVKEKDEQLRIKDQELVSVRSRLKRLTSELGNTHSRVGACCLPCQRWSQEAVGLPAPRTVAASLHNTARSPLAPAPPSAALGARWLAGAEAAGLPGGGAGGGKQVGVCCVVAAVHLRGCCGLARRCVLPLTACFRPPTGCRIKELEALAQEHEVGILPWEVLRYRVF